MTHYFKKLQRNNYTPFVLLILGLGCGSGVATDSKPAVQALSSPAVMFRDSGKVDLHYLLGKFDPSTNPDFVEVSKPYTDRAGMYLQREAFEAFKNMFEAAKKEKVNLRIISATRTFSQQKGIWEEKWSRFAKDAPKSEDRALKILEYSAMPGASRHHWGTDVDLNDLNNPAFEPGGKYDALYKWLCAHAQEYGFCQPYTEKGAERPNGYNEERWHWSYMPVSGPLLTQYLQTVTDTMLAGFTGAETAVSIQAVEHYAAGINKNCK